jgi:hypothetical protein
MKDFNLGLISLISRRHIKQTYQEIKEGREKGLESNHVFKRVVVFNCYYSCMLIVVKF